MVYKNNFYLRMSSYFIEWNIPQGARKYNQLNNEKGNNNYSLFTEFKSNLLWLEIFDWLIVQCFTPYLQ